MEDLKDLSGKVMLQSSGLQTILHKDQSMLSAEKKRYSIDTRKSAFQLKCHCNDKGRPEINFTPKVVAPSQRTGQPALINKKLCFLKNSGLEVIMQLVLLLPLSHLVSGKKRNHDVSPDSEKTPYSKASIFYYTKKTFKRPFFCMK